MYLHYYVNRQHGGQVDLEVIMHFPKGRPFVVIAHNQDKRDLLEAFKLVYGKELRIVSVDEAAKLIAVGQLPIDVFITKKAGPTLKWDAQSKTLCI